MSPESAVTFFITIFFFAVTPGPGVFAILGRSMSTGAWSCLGLCAGMAVSDVLYLVLACFGLATLALHYGAVFQLIRYGGACYLFYLGWRFWTGPVAAPGEHQALGSRGQLAGFLQGFLISAANPKVIVFYIAFLPNFIDLTTFTFQDITMAAGLAASALLCGLMLVGTGGSLTRRVFHSQQALRRLNRTAGATMVGAAVFLAAGD